MVLTITWNSPISAYCFGKVVACPNRRSRHPATRIKVLGHGESATCPLAPVSRQTSLTDSLMTTTTEPKASSAGAPPDEAWRTTDADLPFRVTSGVWRPEIVEKIEKTIARLDAELRELSLDLHAHPELSFKEQ